MAVLRQWWQHDSLSGVKLDVSDGSKSKQPSGEIHQTNTPTSGKGVGAGADPERLPQARCGSVALID
jgi:hypothetical protein